jgi:rhodanese-related sulfurtransferase
MGKITKGIHQLCADAEEKIETWTVEQAKEHMDDENCVIIDIRDVRELWRDGTIPGSKHMPRGMLEFWVDPDSPYAREMFQEDKRFVFFCAGGLRSALATLSVQDMGLSPVCHIKGGFAAWRDAGYDIETREQKK